MKRERGFTLLELILVMVLISITMVFAIPQLSSFVFHDPLKKAARQLTLLVTSVSRLAVRTGEPQSLFYDHQQQLLQTGHKSGDDDELSGYLSMSLPETVTVRDIEFYSGDVVSGGQFSLEFSSKGYLQPCLIHLQDKEGEVLTLQLSPFLATITIHQGDVPLDVNMFGQVLDEVLLPK